MVAAVAACIAASIARPAKNLGRARGNEKNVVRLHRHIRRLGPQDLLQLHRSFAEPVWPPVNDPRTAKIGCASCTARQRDRLQHRQMPAVHEKSAGSSYIAHDVNQVGLANNDRVPGQDGNVALRIVGYIAREGNSNWLVGLVPMRDRNASASLFCKTAGSRDEIEEPLLSRHGIHSRLRNFTQYTCAL